MAKYKVAWLPGDGVGVDVMDAAKVVLDALRFDAEYIHGDIGWDGDGQLQIWVQDLIELRENEPPTGNPPETPAARFASP